MSVPSTVVVLVKVTGVTPATISSDVTVKLGLMTESYTVSMSSLPSVHPISAKSDTTLRIVIRFIVNVFCRFKV